MDLKILGRKEKVLPHQMWTEKDLILRTKKVAFLKEEIIKSTEIKCISSL